MKYKECKISVPKKIYNEFEGFIAELPLEGYYEILFDPDSPKSPSEGIIPDNTKISIYLREDDLESELKLLVFLKLNVPDEFFLESNIIETKDYEESYKEFYTPFEIGKFFVIPTWEKSSFKNTTKDTIPLYLNPGMAFGTGHHETTRLMLERMSQIHLAGKTILDMGTGSGILSIGASLLGASKIIALDIDPNSIRAAEFNWNQNSVSPDVLFLLQEGGFDHEVVGNASYDILLANITYAVISNNIRFISSLRTNHFLFSGIITEKRDDSIKLFTENIGGKMIYEKNTNDWMIIEWSR